MRRGAVCGDGPRERRRAFHSSVGKEGFVVGLTRVVLMWASR